MIPRFSTFSFTLNGRRHNTGEHHRPTGVRGCNSTQSWLYFFPNSTLFERFKKLFDKLLKKNILRMRLKTNHLTNDE